MYVWYILVYIYIYFVIIFYYMYKNVIDVSETQFSDLSEYCRNYVLSHLTIIEKNNIVKWDYNNGNTLKSRRTEFPKHQQHFFNLKNFSAEICNFIISYELQQPSEFFHLHQNVVITGKQLQIQFKIGPHFSEFL